MYALKKPISLCRQRSVQGRAGERTWKDALRWVDKERDIRRAHFPAENCPRYNPDRRPVETELGPQLAPSGFTLFPDAGGMGDAIQLCGRIASPLVLEVTFWEASHHESGLYSRHKRIRRLADHRVLSLEDYKIVIRSLTVRDPRSGAGRVTAFGFGADHC